MATKAGGKLGPSMLLSDSAEDLCGRAGAVRVRAVGVAGRRRAAGAPPPPLGKGAAAAAAGDAPRLRQQWHRAPWGAGARAAAAGAGAGAAPAAPSPAAAHGAWTERLVALSTLPFLLLLVPQIWMNAANQLAGAGDALGALNPTGYLTGLGGNTLLLSYFSSKRELSAALVQAIGIASSFAVLTQLRAAGFVPRPAYAGVAAAVAATAVLTGLKLSGRLDASPRGRAAWAAWQALLGVAGAAVVPQVLWQALGGASLAPGAAAAAACLAAAAADAAGRLPARARGLWAGLSAWTATLLFMLQPLVQLATNLADPAALAGLSLATVALAALGNGLMVPRALWTRDAVWLAGSLWGSLLFGWAQMATLHAARSPATGARFLGGAAFGAATAALWGWFGYVWWRDAAARREERAAAKGP